MVARQLCAHTLLPRQYGHLVPLVLLEIGLKKMCEWPFGQFLHPPFFLSKVGMLVAFGCDFDTAKDIIVVWMPLLLQLWA